MWLERLEIDGFGCLRDIAIDFNQRVTVVTGLNESGKSTLHAAILAALFGLFDSADRRRERIGLEVQERYEPWDGGRYGLRATVRRDGGPAVLVQWDFSGRSSFRVNDALTGEDLTASFRAGAESVLSAPQLAGVSREFFTRACFVRQGELFALEDADRTIAKAIESTASSGGRDASAQRALMRIDQAIREEIGKDAARVRPLPKARLRRDELEHRIASARQARGDLEDLAADTTSAMHDADRLQREFVQLTAVLESRKLVDLQSQIQQIELAERHIAEHRERLAELASVARFSTADEAEIVAADGLRRGAEEQLQVVRQGIDRNSGAVTRLRAEHRSAEEELAALAPYEGAPDSADLERLIDAVARMESVQLSDAEGPIEIPDPPPDLLKLEAQVAREHAELEGLRRHAPAGRRTSTAWVVAAVVSLAGAVGSFAAGVAPGGVALLVVAAVLAIVAWLSGRESPPDGLASAGAELQALETRRAHAAEARAGYERLVAELRGRGQERDQRASEARQQLDSAAAEVDEVLSAAGYTAADRQDAVARFRHAAQQKARRSTVDARVHTLRSQLDGATQPDQERRRLEAELREAELRLTSAYERCGIDESDLDRARETYDERVRLRKRYEEVLNDRSGAEQRLRGLLSGHTLSDIRLAAASLEARGARAETADPELSVQELDSKRIELEKQVADARQHSSRLSGQLETALAAPQEPSGLEEELAQVNDHVAALERAKETLLLAYETLEQAAEETYRDIAPRLNEALGRSLGDVTGGRYREAFVDQEFMVRVRSNEAGQLVDADLLSDGTQDQIYLIERLELARILGGVERLPILLDDPLVHCDEPRRRALGVLFDRVSAEQQLVVLSTDPAVAELLSETCEQCEVIDLDGLRHSSMARP